MERPAVVEAALDGEDVVAVVGLGDEDAVFFTPTRTLRYEAEGLFSDESVESYSHDIQRLDIVEKRRKTTFTLDSVEGTESFSVPKNRGDQVLERLLGGVLRTTGVLDPEEAVHGVYLFSELTLVVSEGRLLKHVGTVVWDGDHEVFRYDDLHHLAFEEGSVATQIIVSVEGQIERIKAPNEAAPLLKRTLTDAVCAHHGVETLTAVNEMVGPAGVGSTEGSAPTETPTDSDVDFGDSIDPLVEASGPVSDSGAVDSDIDRIFSTDQRDTAEADSQSVPASPPRYRRGTTRVRVDLRGSRRPPLASHPQKPLRRARAALYITTRAKIRARKPPVRPSTEMVRVRNTRQVVRKPR